MAIPPFVLGDRDCLETTARRQAQTVHLAEGSVICRVLGKYLMFVDPHDLGLTPRLCLDGYWESWITRAIARSVRPGNWCVDVGANHGYYTLIMADAAGKDGRVLAVEPNPSLAGLAALSVEVNGFTAQTRIVQKAVTDGAAPRARLVVPRRRGACATICREATADDEVVDVDAASVDELTAEWPQVDLVKVDAEGAEDAIWRGMRGTIARNPGLSVFLEFVPSRYRDPGAFVREIVDAGFSLREIGHDSEVTSVAEDDLANDDEDEGRMLYLRRDS
jgi:FkbM family methyltransferase